ncbi:hypothetical protein G6F56_006765 [Rhizopus delemar]|nr:hypothetical protein G6F56_006765 [Rhizopus delemar]
MWSLQRLLQCGAHSSGTPPNGHPSGVFSDHPNGAHPSGTLSSGFPSGAHHSGASPKPSDTPVTSGNQN